MSKKRLYYFYICDDCGEAIPQRLDTIKDMKNPVCRICYNRRKGRENRDKISATLIERWKKIPEDEKRKFIENSFRNEASLKKGIETRKQGYAEGRLHAWNEGLHKRTNTGRTHFKKGQIPWNYKGGISYIRGKDWDVIRKQIYSRDKHKCQICNKSHIKLYCHHIIPYSEIQDNSEDNLITLCLSCHVKIEQMYVNKCNRPKYFNIINTWRLNKGW